MSGRRRPGARFDQLTQRPLQLPSLDLQVLEAEDPQPHGGVQGVLDRLGDVIGRQARHRTRRLVGARGGSAAASRPFATVRVGVEPEEQPLASPPVLAVVVTHGRHGDRLQDLLGALAEQDYPQLSVMAVDAAKRVLDLPLARGAEFFLFCHDDVLPDPGAVRALVAASAEWDADVVGPKFVARDDPHRLLQVGLAVDRVGSTRRWPRRTTISSCAGGSGQLVPGCWWPPTPACGGTRARPPTRGTRPGTGCGRCSGAPAASTSYGSCPR